jgi:hypothetical protein
MPFYTFLQTLLNALLQIANKMKLQKKICSDYFESSAPHCQKHYTPAGNEGVLDTAVRRHTKFSNDIFWTQITYQ